jgi:DNA repair exonuclease SbcCD nuclease subunit
MKKDKYALFTDLHLGVHQNSITWHNIALEWADWFIQELKSKDVKKIIFTGDFFHSRSEISVNTIQAAANFLDKFKDFKLYMIPGNHDCYYKDKANIHSLSILKGYDNITVFDEVSTLDIGEHKVTFCPWGYESEDIDNCSALFGHFEIETFKMNAHKLCEVGVKPKDLLKKSPLIFSGHFHLNEEREYKEGKIIYVGSPFQLDFGERDCRKGYYILTFDDKIKYDFYDNTISPVHKKILLSDIQDADLEKSCKAIANNFIKFVIDIKLEQNEIDKVIHNLNSLKPQTLIVDPQVNYNITIDDQNDCDLSGVDVSKAIVEFVNMLDIEDKEDVIKRTLFLYNQVK